MTRLAKYWTSLIRPLAFVHESLSEFDALGIVDVEDGDSRPAGLSSADENGANPFEVPAPRLPSGVEEPDDVIR